jgi:GH25 family lysozyme M1 (1,4-beta-N-acetylmuramidase)
MKSSAVIFASILGLVSGSPSSFDKRSQPQGLDVSGWQGDVNWSQVKANGASFAMIKVSLCLEAISTLLLTHCQATESIDYINAYFAQQYNGAYNVGRKSEFCIALIF